MPAPDVEMGAPQVIGLMSGTSVDGIDGVLLALSAADEVTLIDTVKVDFPADVQRQVEAVVDGSATDLHHLGALHTHLGYLYADAANRLKPDGGDVAVIGCPGQTVCHHPHGAFPFTLQLGCGAVVAQRTGIPTVTDFRSADIAAGGQGAPLACGFHRAVFASADAHRAVLNLGGIANLTHLAAGATDATGAACVGFDSGPGNTLLDGWQRRHFHAPYDREGAVAARGSVHPPLLRRMLADPYFARPAPKSTGREYFNQSWVDGMLDPAAALSPQDIQATLTALTATSVAQQVARLTPAVAAVYVCGGGVHNRTLMAMLEQHCHCPVHTTTELGMAPQWVEAGAFGWMAHHTLHRRPATLPAVTGAARPTIAGAIHYPH